MEFVLIFISSPILVFIVLCIFVLGAKMDPPVLGVLLEEGGGEDDHERGVTFVVSSEHLEIGDTVPYEAFNVVMGSLKAFWLLHQEGLHVS